MSITGQPDGDAGRRTHEGGRGGFRPGHRPLHDHRHPGRASPPGAHRRGPVDRHGAVRLPGRGAGQPGDELLVGGLLPTRLGNAHPNIVPYQVFATADGYLILGVANDRQFASFAKAAGVETISADPRFATNAARVATPRSPGRASDADAPDRGRPPTGLPPWKPSTCPADRSTELTRSSADPQAIARGLTVAMQHAAAGTIDLVASPLRLSRTPPEYRSAPPLLGEHTDEILERVLAIQPSEIARLRREKIV